MDSENKSFRSKVFSHLNQLAQESPAYDDAKMLVGSADTVASLKNNTVYRSIDTEWIEKIEYTIPYLDEFIRNPGIAIQEIEEVLPVEATKKISEKSIRYLAQHTNHILKIENGEVTPSKILNVFRDETFLTYENKFINTLLIRLIAFIEKRFNVLKGTSGIERNYIFDYQTAFEHSIIENQKNSAKMTLKIEFTSPVNDNLTEQEQKSNLEYASVLKRLEKIYRSIMSYLSSPLIMAIGKNYIRPPVIRTNPILKNKNLNACLTLWEYIESVDKAGFSTITDEFREMPSDEYISELYSSVALQYLQFYSGVVGDDADNRLLSERRINETFPDFDSELDLEEKDDYVVYDTDYRKLVSASEVFEKRRKLSEDERKIRVAIEVALRADKVLFEQFMADELERRKAEAERRRLEEEMRKAEEERLAKLLEEQERRKNIEYRYIRTYMARLIQAEDNVKDMYNVVKNKLLSYKKVKCRLSKKRETFYLGRQTLVKLDVKGKKLDLYLALDPSEFNEKSQYYNYIDISEKNALLPMLIKVSGPIKLRRALELIDILMAKVGALALTNYAEQDYHMPYETTDALVRKGLIIDLWNKTPMEEPDKEQVIEPVAQEIAVSQENDKLKFKARYIRTYLARLIQAEDSVKDMYNVVKNKLLSYKKVKSRLSKKRETFYVGRTALVKLDVKGKKVDLYLALNPSEFNDKAQYYNFIDISQKNTLFTMLMKVSGPIKLRRALDLIDILMAKVGVVAQNNYAEQDYHMPYETTEELIERGLIIDLEKAQEQLEQEQGEQKEPQEDDNQTKAQIVDTQEVELIEQENEVLDAVLGKEDSSIIRDNESFYNGEKCVFKPYFEGYQTADAVIIPMTKDEFDSLKEKKKLKIFNSALKKFNKRIKKSKKK